MRVSIVGLVLLLTGCPRSIPPHLRVDAPDPVGTTPTQTIETYAELLDAIVAGDPLVRAPDLPSREALKAVEESGPIGAWVQSIRALERGEGEVELLLQQIEEQHPGTPAVPLARGYRLRNIENRLTKLQTPNEPVELEVLGLLTPLRVADGVAGLPKRPLEWLGPNASLPQLIRDVGDRWVLEAWLSSPSIPVDAVARALAGSPYDGLRERPLGALVLARAAKADGDPTAGLADLERATRLALEKAAADRDAEQARWSDTKKAAIAELGNDKPEAFLLGRAHAALVAAAGDDRAAGAALLAIAASRWHGSCPDTPCGGLDRVQLMRSAMAWHPDVERLAHIWQVIALKESLDTLEAGRESVIFPSAMVDLSDALLGTGAGPLDGHLVRRKSPDPAVWLALGRSVGTDGVTDWAGARAALGTHLERQARLAREKVEDPETQQLLDRIIRRAIP